MTLDNFRQDCGDSKKHLEDIIGSSVCGYRAPSFSINDYVLNSIKEAGYLYDSSYNSFALQGRYGKISLNGNSINGIAHRMSNGLYELPISNLHLKFATNNNQLTTFTRRSRAFVVPFGGGAYFRLIPFYIFKHGAGKILKKQNAYVFYLHPWELDPKQQRVSQASSSRKFRHYTNLHLTEKKLRKLIDNFGNCQFVTATDYLNAVSTSGTC